jgi:UDP-glucose 4-epimerase
MNFKDKVIVVTGGAGFIGSHLVDRLIEESPKKIIVQDNLFLGCQENIADALKHDELVTFLNIDISNAEQVETFYRTTNVDIVFDLATIPLPTSLEKPAWATLQNTQMAVNLCECARKHYIDRIIHLSSSEVYGTAMSVPMDETHPWNPETPYAASKAAADHIYLSYRNTFGIDVAVIRPFNQYGPRQNSGSYSGIIPRLSKAIMDEKTFEIYGDGEQTRDFLYVTDTVDAIVKISQKDESLGKIINLGSGTEISVNEIVQTIADFYGVENNFKHTSPRPGDVRRHYAGVNLAKKQFGFSPKVSFKEGIAKTCTWYKETIGKE